MMESMKILPAVVICLICIMSHEEVVNGQSCTVNSDCTPCVECGVTTWECSSVSSDDPLHKTCCEHLNTCGELASGYVMTREVSRPDADADLYSRNVWLDMYITNGSDTFVSSQYAGSWHTFTENATSCVASADEFPNNVFVLEPTSSCPSGFHAWPDWYNVALAASDKIKYLTDYHLNISGLAVDETESRDCMCDLQSVCEAGVCRHTTTFVDIDRSPYAELPLKTERHGCYDRIGIEHGVGILTASSTFAQGYDVEGARLNTLANPTSLEGGWIPNLDDDEKWFKTTFPTELWISGLITQGLKFNIEKRTDTFIVSYYNSTGGPYIANHTAGKVFSAGARLDTEVTIYFDTPVRANVVTIHIVEPCSNGFIGLRFELLGCSVCYNSSSCDETRYCTEEGICDIASLVIDEENYLEGEAVLDANNATEQEHVAYDTLVTTSSIKNLSTVVYADVTVNVARACLTALTNVSAAGNATPDQNIAFGIERIEVFVVVAGNTEEVGVFNDLDTPEKIEQVEELVEDVVDLVAHFFAPENTDAWNLMAEIKVATDSGGTSEGGTVGNDGSGNGGTGGEGTGGTGGEGTGGTGGEGTGGTGGNGTGGTGAGGSSSGGVKVESSLSEKDQKEKAKSETATNMLTGVANMASTVAIAKDGKLVFKTSAIEIQAGVEDSANLETDGFNYATDETSDLGASLSCQASDFDFGQDGESVQVVITVVVIATAALRTDNRPDTQISTGVAQQVGYLASNLLSFDMYVNGDRVSVPIKFTLSYDPVAEDKNGKALEKPTCVSDECESDDGCPFTDIGISTEIAENGKANCQIDTNSIFAIVLQPIPAEAGDSPYHIGLQTLTIIIGCGLCIIAIAVVVLIIMYCSTLTGKNIELIKKWFRVLASLQGTDPHWH